MCDNDLKIGVNQYNLLRKFQPNTYYDLDKFEKNIRLLNENLEFIKVQTVFNCFEEDLNNYRTNITFIKKLSNNDFAQIQYMIDILEIKNKVYYTAIYNYLLYSVKRILLKYLEHIDEEYHINIINWYKRFEIRLKKKVENLNVKLFKEWISKEILNEFMKLYEFLKENKKNLHLQSNTILLNLNNHSKYIEQYIYFDKLIKFYSYWNKMKYTLIRALYSKLNFE